MQWISYGFWLVAVIPLIYYGRQVTLSLQPQIPLRNESGLPNDVLSLTQALVDIPSASGSEQAAFAYASTWLKSQNFSTVLQPVPPLAPGQHPRSNLLALHPEANISDIRVLLSTHLDTVPGTVTHNATDSNQTDNSKLYGRGSVDAKGQAAAMLLTLRTLYDARLAVLLVCGEETDHAGMLNAHNLGFGKISLINGEPTDSKVATRQKGMIRAKIEVSGRSAHSGYPHLGDSAIHKLIDLLQHLGRDTCREDGTTLNVGSINGGVAANVVADSAEAIVMWRVVSNADAITRPAIEIVKLYSGAKLHILKMNDAMDFYTPDVSSQVGTTTVAYNTDVPYYQGITSRVVLFGAGSIHQAHTAEEYIDKPQLEALPLLYQRIAQQLLQEEAR